VSKELDNFLRKELRKTIFFALLVIVILAIFLYRML